MAGGDIGAYSVEDARAIYAAYHRLVALGLLNDNGGDLASSPTRGIVNDFALLNFRNDSAYTIPPYGFMQVIGAVDVIPGGKNYIKVDRPNANVAIQGEYLVNGSREVLTNEFGTAQSGPVYRVQCVAGSASIATGVRLGPDDGLFTGNLGCGYWCYGPDDILPDVWRCSRNDSKLWAMTKTGGIAANSYAQVVGDKPKAAANYWEADTVEYRAYSRNVAVVGIKLVMLLPINGRWCAEEVC